MTILLLVGLYVVNQVHVVAAEMFHGPSHLIKVVGTESLCPQVPCCGVQVGLGRPLKIGLADPCEVWGDSTNF